LKDTESSDNKTRNARLFLADETVVALYPKSGIQGAAYRVDTSIVFSNVPDGKLSTATRKFAELCRTFADNGCLRAASLYSDGAGLNCIPDVPLIFGASHVTYVSEQQIADAYEDGDTFRNADWDSVRQFGDSRLLTRGLDAKTTTEYLKDLLPMQWSLARAARAGLTEFWLPTVEPEEEAVYGAGAKTLEIVGHLAGENLVELTCSLSPGEHINGWEVYDLLALMESGELPDGRVVDKVRVVFIEKETALQEKRVLLDIGVEVHAYNDDGELIQITD
jgi:hypothetical protein